VSKNDMGFFMDDEDDAGIEFEDFVKAIGVWGWMRAGGQPTVREVGDSFNVTDQVIINAVKAHPWMYLEGDESDDPVELKIGYDGE
jgi:hypothetical protein